MSESEGALGVDDGQGEQPIGAMLGELADAADAAAGDYARQLARKHRVPAALDAERAILGGVLLHPPAYKEAVDEGLRAADFFRPVHGTIWRAIEALAKRGTPVDSITVTDELARRHELDGVGGAAAIAQLEALLPTAAHVGAYARLVREKALARAVMRVAEDLIAAASAQSSRASDLTAYAERALTGLRIDAGASDFRAAVERARQELGLHALGTADVERTTPLFEPTARLITIELPKTDWLIRGLLTGRSVAATGGEPKSTKTWAGIEMLLSVATGTKAFGEFQATGPRTVAALLVEDGLASFRNRLFALAQGRHMSREIATRRMYDRCLVALDLRKERDVAYLIASIRALPEPPAIVLLDPLRDLIGGAEENSASEMSAVLHAFRAIRNITGATVLFVHHSGKSSADTKGRRGGQKLRGSSAIHGALDCGLYLSDTKGNLQTNWKNCVQAEIKGLRGAGIFGLELDVVDDADDAAVTAGWRYYSEVSDMEPPSEAGGSPAVESGPTRALAILRREYESAKAKDREVRPMSSSSLAEALRTSKTTVGRWLKQLTDERYLDVHTTGFTYREIPEQR